MMETEEKTQHTCSGQGCLCHGAGPLLSDFLRRMGPPEGAKRHFEAARLEFLKGVRSMLDARIEDLTRAEPKGTKVNVE